jgi:hypothetical protein
LTNAFNQADLAKKKESSRFPGRKAQTFLEVLGILGSIAKSA